MLVSSPVDIKATIESTKSVIEAMIESVIAQLSSSLDIKAMRNAVSKGIIIKNGSIILTTS
jgi:hypothetical protein